MKQRYRYQINFARLNEDVEKDNQFQKKHKHGRF